MAERTDLSIRRLAASLESAQKELASIGGSLGSSAADLRKELSKRLRDARRDATKLGKSVRSDLARLPKDLSKQARR